MESIFAFIIVAVTSVTAYQFTVWKRAAAAEAMSAALTSFFECVGAFVFFLIANVMFGAIVILLIRRLTSVFVPLYALENLLLLLLSAVQGLLFQLWWKHD